MLEGRPDEECMDTSNCSVFCCCTKVTHVQGGRPTGGTFTSLLEGIDEFCGAKLPIKFVVIIFYLRPKRFEKWR